MTHERSDERELLGTLDHAFDLVYHDVKEAVHAAQKHHGYETHRYELEPAVEDSPFEPTQHGVYGGSYMPIGHTFIPHANSEVASAHHGATHHEAAHLGPV